MPTVNTQPAIKSACRKHAGFSLVEVLVVVMVILIIAAIAIPNLLHGKMLANEASAAVSVKAIQVAETLYANAYPEVGFSGSLPNLGRHGSTCDNPTRTNSCILMDDLLTSGIKNGYMFEVVNDGRTPSLSYTVNATPESNVTGRCAISTNEGGALRYSAPSGGSGSGTVGRSVGSGGAGGGCD